MSEKEEQEKETPTLEEVHESKEEAKESQDPSCSEYKERYIRLLAEQENMRKRMMKEKQETIRFAIDNAIGEFIPQIDNFENALKFAEAGSDEVRNWAAGFQMILSQFKDVLHNHGIVAYHSEGNLFDPHYHEAVEIHETNEHPDGTILEEFAKGYKSAKRTIRPARVKVAKKPKKESKDSPEESEDPELSKKTKELSQ